MPIAGMYVDRLTCMTFGVHVDDVRHPATTRAMCDRHRARVSRHLKKNLHVTESGKMRPPHVLKLFEALYDTRDPRNIQRILEMVRRDRRRLRLPAEYAHLWPAVYASAFDPTLNLSKNANADALRLRLGNALARYLQVPQYDEKNVQRLLLRTTCVLNRLGGLDATALRKLPARSGCRQSNIPVSMPASNTILEHAQHKLSNLATNTPSSTWVAVKRLVESATPSEAHRLKGIVTEVVNFLQREYAKTFMSFSKRDVKPMDIPTEYESLLANGVSALKSMSRILRAAACDGESRAKCSAKIRAVDGDVVQLISNSSNRNSRPFKKYADHIRTLIHLSDLAPTRLSVLRRAYAILAQYEKVAPKFVFSHPRAVSVVQEISSRTSANRSNQALSHSFSRAGENLFSNSPRSRRTRS